MSSGSLISIIVPAYNAGGYLERCIGSILGQSHREVEVIAVNDCSSDETGAILDRLAETDARLKVIHLDKNEGVHAARSHGVRAAMGAYIGFVDSDDWINPDMYKSMYVEIVRENAQIVVCGAITASSENRLGAMKVRFRKRRVFRDDLLRRFCNFEFGSGVLWNKLYAADLMRRHAVIPLSRQIDAGEDYIVNVGCFLQATTIVAMPDCLYYYFERPGSASRSVANALGFCRVLRAYTACLDAHVASLSPREVAMLDGLYARQFRFSSYRVVDPKDLDEYAGDLQNSLRQLADIHPKGIYSLVHAFDHEPRRSQLEIALRKVVSPIKRALLR